MVVKDMVISMLQKIKDNYVNICIAAAYTITACMVYGSWSYSTWHLWYVTMIIVIVIVIVGFVIGFLWINGEIAKKLKQSEEKQSQQVEQQVIDKE